MSQPEQGVLPLEIDEQQQPPLECQQCRRKLRTPVSRERGRGPVCYKKWFRQMMFAAEASKQEAQAKITGEPNKISQL